MCEILEKLTDQDGLELKRQVQQTAEDVDGIKEVIANWRGSVAVAKWVIGINISLMVLILGTLITLSIALVSRLGSMDLLMNTHDNAIRVFEAGGPRFNETDYDRRLKADLADYTEKQQIAEMRAQFAALKDNDTDIRSSTESNQRRIEALEKAILNGRNQP